MKLRFLIAFSVIVAVTSLQALTLKATHPNEYVVQKGDTLWYISAQFFTTPWQWPKIWQVNPEIKNPHLIYPGDVVKLKKFNGQYRLVVDKKSQKKWANIDVKGFMPFFKNYYLTNEKAYNAFNQVVSVPEFRSASKRPDRIYVVSETPLSQGEYMVFKKPQQIHSPHTNISLGYLVVPVAQAKWVRNDQNVSELKLAKSILDVQVHDYFLKAKVPSEKVFRAYYMSKPVSGEVLKIVHDSIRGSQFNTIVMNVGQDQTVEKGAVLSIYTHPRTTEALRPARDAQQFSAEEKVQIPGHEIAKILVYQVADQMSLGLVLHATESINIGDPVKWRPS